MTHALFIDPAVSYRLELAHAWRSVRYAQAYQRLHPQAQCATLALGGGYAVYVGAGSPLNGASGLGLSGPVSLDLLQALEDFYQARGAVPRLTVSPLADKGLFALLRHRGYRLNGFFSVLVRALPEDFQPGPLPEGLSVAQARPEEASLWLQVTGQGFESGDSPSAALMDILGPNFHAEDSAPYLAWINDPITGRQPAGGGGMYYHQGVVELGGASTRPQYRRRGVQRALIEARLAHARGLGCDLSMVLTSPGTDSQRNVERAGFHLAYTSMILTRDAAAGL